MTTHHASVVPPRISPATTPLRSTPPLGGATHLGATLAGLLVSLLIVLAPIAGLVSAGLRDDPVGLVPTPSPGPAPIPAQIPVRILLH